MRPSFEMLIFQMTKIWSIQAKPAADFRGRLNLPMIYTPSMIIPDRATLLMSGDYLPVDGYFENIGCLIVWGGTTIPSMTTSQCSVILIENAVTEFEVLNQVQAIFMLFQDWEDQLRQIVERNGSLQELLDCTSPIIENTLGLTDQGFNLLAASSQGKRIDDDLTILGTSSREATFQAFKSASRQVSPNHFRLNLQQIRNLDEHFEIFFINIFEGKINIGAISVHPTEHVLSEYDQQLLDILCDFVRIQLGRSFQLDGKFFRDSIIALLTGLPISADEEVRLKSALNIGAEDKLRCVVIKLTPEIGKKNSAYLQHRFQIEISASIAVIHDRYMVGLINVDKGGWHNQDIVDYLNRWIGKMNLCAGVSDPFSDISSIKNYYLAAKAILPFAHPDGIRVKVFSDGWEEFVLKNCTGALPAELLFPPGLKRVIEYNQTSAVDYIETLRIWLEERQNDSRTAARLFICRNSFLSRRDRLVVLLGEDLDDPDVRFRLELCLRLL